MRKELPIAIILIAAGVSLWAGKNGGVNRLKDWFSRGQNASISGEGPGSASPFLQASNQRSDSSTVQGQEFKPATVSSLPTPAIASLKEGFEQTNLESSEFLKEFGIQIRKSAPFRVDLAIRMDWNEVPLIVAGRYSQLGRESGQSRVDLRIGDGAETKTLSKVCDGRFLYTLQQYREKKQLEFIDLRRIQETRHSAGLTQPENPTNWIATGGLASLFENVAAAFQFAAPENFEHEGKQYVRLNGTWMAPRIVELLKDSVPSHHLEPQITWKELPRQVPHQLSLVFVKLDDYGWIPRQVSFFHFVSDNPAGNRLVEFATVDFSLPVGIETDADSFLNLDTEGVETIDKTHLYVTQFKRFEMQREAKANNNPVLR